MEGFIFSKYLNISSLKQAPGTSESWGRTLSLPHFFSGYQVYSVQEMMIFCEREKEWGTTTASVRVKTSKKKPNTYTHTHIPTENCKDSSAALAWLVHVFPPGTTAMATGERPPDWLGRGCLWITVREPVSSEREQLPKCVWKWGAGNTETTGATSPLSSILEDLNRYSMWKP